MCWMWNEEKSPLNPISGTKTPKSEAQLQRRESLLAYSYLYMNYSCSCSCHSATDTWSSDLARVLSYKVAQLVLAAKGPLKTHSPRSIQSWLRGKYIHRDECEYFITRFQNATADLTSFPYMEKRPTECIRGLMCKTPCSSTAWQRVQRSEQRRWRNDGQGPVGPVGLVRPVEPVERLVSVRPVEPLGLVGPIEPVGPVDPTVYSWSIAAL